MQIRIYERITPYTDLEALKGCEMVIEAVPEIMDLKKKVYAELHRECSVCIQY